MKNHSINLTHEEACIYRRHYQPSLNPLTFLKSVLAVLISGSSPAAKTFIRKK